MFQLWLVFKVSICLSYPSSFKRAYIAVVDEDIQFTELRHAEAIGRFSHAQFTASSGRENGNACDLQQFSAEGHRAYRRHGIAVRQVRHRIVHSIAVGAIRRIAHAGSIRAE